MTYFLYGPNTYLIREKVAALKDKFLVSDPTGMNLAEIDGQSIQWSRFVSAVSAAPFLTRSRLVVVKNLLLENKDNDLKKKIAGYLPKIPESSVVFFVEYGSPDQKGTLFKALSKKGTVQKIEALSKLEFSRWAKEKFSSFGVSADPLAIDQLDSSVQGDLFRAGNEIEKLSLFAKARDKSVINFEDVSLLVVSPVASNIFDFVDALAGKDAKKAALSVTKLLEDGKNELYILTMVVLQFRNLLIISDLKQEGLSPDQIAKAAKLHPFVIKKSTAALSKFAAKKLSEIYGLLYETDLKIKTGQLAPDLGIWMLIEKICK